MAGREAWADASFTRRTRMNFDLPRFAGWWGHDQGTRFLMGPQFRPSAGAEGWQLSNPPIMAMAPLRASLELFATAGILQLRKKSVSLTGYLEFLLDQDGSDKFTIITPRDPERRGAQLSIRIRDNGRAVLDRLTAEGIICDWREPDILRVAPAPLYNTFSDVLRFSQRFLATLR